ncbi:MAG: GlcG/HbpS family heme-binding protein, partial [Candidatus Binatia bacterium]
MKANKTLAAVAGLTFGTVTASLLLMSTMAGCGSESDSCPVDQTGAIGILTSEDVQRAVFQAAAFAEDLGTRVTIAVSDRQGNPLAIFAMNGSPGVVGFAYTNARTAAYFSTNGNAFTTRTAGFIIQDQYPPGVPNTPAGPLFGVQFSSLQCSDIQRTGAQFVTLGIGLSNFPGSIPLYKDGLIAGGLGVNGSGDPLTDERIALAGGTGFEVPRPDMRGDRIFVDGFSVGFTEA